MVEQDREEQEVKASQPEKVATVKTVLGVRVDDLNLGYKTTLIAYLEVGDQQKSLGVHRSRGGLHAEEHLLVKLRTEWNSYAVKGEKNRIVINLTRSPCGVDKHDCSGQLANFVHEKSKLGWDVGLQLNMASLYGGSSSLGKPLRPSSVVALEKLSTRKVELAGWNVINILKEKGGVNPNEIPPKEQAKLERRVAELETVLDEIEEKSQCAKTK